MDEDSEEEEESSDDEFMLNEDQVVQEEEEELNLTDIKIEKGLDEENKYCPWLDEDPASLPKLELPESSQDIPIPTASIMDAVEIYEILRSYHRTLRITPFTFEDFCAALISHNNSCIMAEVHMALLRNCLKSDDEEQTHYSVTETNNSVNIMIHHMDTLTYAEILRQYIEAYPFADASVRDAINVDNYPFVGYDAKLVVLLFMSYRFLYSSEFKKLVNNVGKFQNDENCRVCGKSSGRVVGCTQCEAAFHVECSHLKPFPEVLVCNICKKNSAVRGVLPPDEAVDREPLRSQPIGRDRYGRYYWFIVRRLVVQSLDETELYYYSTVPQLYQLLQKLDRTYYEKDLCDTIRLRIDEFLEQMALTVEMTSERREAALETMVKRQLIGYDFAEATTPQIYLHRDSMKRMASILRDCAQKGQVKQEVKLEEPVEGQSPVKCVQFVEDSILPESMIGIFDAKLINTFWSGGATQEELVEQFVDISDNFDAPSANLWRMGDEGNDQTFMTYYNYYSRNEMSESFLTRKKAADKKKYMASKFAQIDNFDWVVAKNRQFYGDASLHCKFIMWTLQQVIKNIPIDLMHRKWPEFAKGFDLEVSVADDYKKLVTCLLKLDCAVRKTIFMPQWWNGLGQTRLERITVDQRENFMKEQQRLKKIDADALTKDLDDSFVRVNYMKPKWPNTYILRQRGETYRNAGKGSMGGWAWVAAKYVEKWIQVPESPKLPLAVTVEEIKTESVSNRKARRLELLVSKITKKRQRSGGKSSKKPTFELTNGCYSPSCRSNPNRKCYSPMCRNGYLVSAKQAHDERKLEESGVLGEEKAWPIPEIQTFSTKRGGKSIFVLQKNSRILRQMIMGGGCQQVYMPGFSAGIKSNLLIWPYPAPRPTLDLCWKWQTLNARSLHAVALQLKIIWSSIKFNEFDPDDTHPDRRVVIDTPSHDERRRIIRHKEMPPYGQYERYEMEIEIIPLYDEPEEEDESWLSRNRGGSSEFSHRSSSARKKRPQRSLDNRRATAIRREWVDGVTLKVFEIKDYWKWIRAEAEKTAKRKLEATRKAQKAKEDEERRRIQQQQQRSVARIPVPMHSLIPSERNNVPYLGSQQQRRPNGNERGFLEKYNNSSSVSPQAHGYASTPPPGYHQPQPNIIRQAGYNQLPRKPTTSPFNFQSRPVATIPTTPQLRAAAGADGVVRAVMMTPGNKSTVNTNSTPYPQALNRQQYQLQRQQQQPAVRRLTNGYHFMDGTMRGGGRNPSVQMHQRLPQNRAALQRPFGESTTEMRRVTEAAIPDNDGDEQPPVIPRYDPTSNFDAQRAQQQHPQSRPVYSTPAQMIRTTQPGGVKHNVILMKASDGTQKMVLKPGQFPPGTVISTGQRVVPYRQPTAVQQRQLYTATPGTRVVRIPNANGGAPRQQDHQVMRRVVQASGPRAMEYMDDQGTPPPGQQVRYVLQGGNSGTPNVNPPKVSSRGGPRGGLTMQMVQQQQQHNPEHRRLLAGRQKQKVTTYRDFMASRGYLDTSKFMMQTKPTFLPFEFNEEEEREINEAIAREEAWMRQEEENKTSGYDSSGNPIRSITSSGDTQRAPPYVSNLLPSSNDSPDDKVIKQVLDVMFSQVCRWDRQYGWSKTHVKRARQKNDSDKMHLRKFRMNQRELLITDHMERLKKEINKRRTRMENEAEQQCGLLTPWRKARARPHRAAKPKAEVKKEVINPADITLGGDTYDYVKEQKPTESIATNVSRRRRTSANLSKSEDDRDKPESQSTAPKSKERRTSEPPASHVAFHTPGSATPHDINLSIEHCTCQKIFDASKLYIQCELCARWYHGDCVGVAEQTILGLEHWSCEECIEEQERVKDQPALYCVCQKPYDDTKFYVGCDSCQGWFHPECVGTTRAEAEQAADYNCPACTREAEGYESEASDVSGSSRVSVQLTRADYTHVFELLELLLEHRMSTPFRNPVDLNEFPDYEKFIKKPMDLSTITKKVERTEYLYLSQFVNDVNQMFENAKTYNPKGNAVFKCAETMQEVFDKKLIDVREQMTARQQMLLLATAQQQDPMSSIRKRVQSESQRTVDSLDIDSDQLLPLDANLMRLYDF
ncbi:Nucleosome-remodeling factor subunit NURF301 [Caenorhabditis elegans]|nr:Nucleosome-remodeling factor subunit NURF301 [Caenorhabditis elegans]CTQ86477.1 Nucleosome-remodeling factor subunit NURF301 [Caenorhabditis elegans]|eukprot:NP_001300538.1 Nucleosome-remodeling factor subunit NURF301-like [Caenorhabditis elegans]